MVCRATGRLDFLQVAQTIERMVGDRTAREARRAILVLDEDAFASLGTLAPLIPLVRHWSERVPGQRWAVVAPNHLCQALAKLTLPTLSPSVAAAQSFVSEPEAMEWLQSELFAIQAGAE